MTMTMTMTNDDDSPPRKKKKPAKAKPAGARAKAAEKPRQPGEPANFQTPDSHSASGSSEDPLLDYAEVTDHEDDLSDADDTEQDLATKRLNRFLRFPPPYSKLVISCGFHVDFL